MDASLVVSGWKSKRDLFSESFYSSGGARIYIQEWRCRRKPTSFVFFLISNKGNTSLVLWYVVRKNVQRKVRWSHIITLRHDHYVFVKMNNNNLVQRSCDRYLNENHWNIMNMIQTANFLYCKFYIIHTK